MRETLHATTILAVRRPGEVVMAADGQVSLGQRVAKHSAKKLRRLQDGQVLTGFAGSAADAFALLERFEGKLKDYSGNITRASVELTKDWRTDRALRRLEAMLLVADKEKTLMLSGSGDVIEPEHGVISIGSGADYAIAAARALVDHSEMSAKDIASYAMNIAGELCVYTNQNIDIHHLEY